MPGHLPEPADFHPWTFTEWIEATMVLEELDEISRTALSERFPAGMSPGEDEVEQMLSEVRRRSAAAPDSYPFAVADTRVVRQEGVDAVPYDFLLLLSLQYAPYRREGRFEEINPAFELLAREALVRHLGRGAEGRRFAYPTRDDRPESFREAVVWLARLMGLEIGSLSDVDGVDNDGGVDVAAWRSFGDGRPAHLCVLAQCTVEVEYDKTHKVHDVEPMQWFAWMRFGRPPMSALVVPFVIPQDAKLWARLSARCDLLLDRVRLAELLNPQDLTEFDEYKEMQDFIVRERELMLTALAAEPTRDRRRDKRPRTVRRRRAVSGRAVELAEEDSEEQGAQGKEGGA
jgi:hypothetical protein